MNEINSSASIFDSGRFFVGCNYWASHAGTNMWSDWRPDVVDDDLKRLAENGVTMVRVFPLWPVFQPITMLYSGGGWPREYRFGEDPIPDTDVGRAGMSEDALVKFAAFCDMAEKHGIHLIVGLITGWMSGRLFVPPALDGKNVLSDPTAVMWETRFVRCFVERFKGESSIVAWDLGNECNCMAPVKSADEFFVWTSNIVGAIHSKDTSRPIISGMHSLLPNNEHPIQHQAELTDILTTHPYPYFTAHCNIDPIHTMRTGMHAAAESLFYRGIGGKPCFVEECGTLGPMFADEKRAHDFVRNNLYTLWAHNCMGFLWWCANEQTELTHAPYDWNSVERELGLFRADKSPKPVLAALGDFAKFIDELEIENLPPRLTDGICILTRGQDTWGAAYMSFALAKQTGLELEFAYADQPLPDAPFYMMPSISSDSFMTGRRFADLLEKVANGAVLYISLNSGLISPFCEFSGVRVISREAKGIMETVAFNDGVNQADIPVYRAFKLKMEAEGAEVLAYDAEGDPLYTAYGYGKGKVFFLAAPLEDNLTKISRAFEDDSLYPLFYEPIKRELAARVSAKAASVQNRNIGITEHVLTDSRRWLILINYDPTPHEAALALADGWAVKRFLRGSLAIGGNDAAVLEIVRH